jgi:hypothetical protein
LACSFGLPTNSTFLTKPAISNQAAVFLSEQISAEHQPPANRTGINILRGAFSPPPPTPTSKPRGIGFEDFCSRIVLKLRSSPDSRDAEISPRSDPSAAPRDASCMVTINQMRSISTLFPFVFTLPIAVPLMHTRGMIVSLI